MSGSVLAGYYAYEWLSFMEFTTDAHGYYTTTALAPGSYFVRATIPPQYDRERWYTVEPKIQRPTAVTLITGTHAVDVDVSYAPASGLYLPLVPDPAK